MKKIAIPVLLALVLSACGTTGSKDATVEDRTGGSSVTTVDKVGAGAGAESTGVDGAGVEGSARLTPNKASFPIIRNGALSSRSATVSRQRCSS